MAQIDPAYIARLESRIELLENQVRAAIRQISFIQIGDKKNEEHRNSETPE